MSRDQYAQTRRDALSGREFERDVLLIALTGFIAVLLLALGHLA